MQVVVVLSGSMEPAFYRGDILFLYMGKKPFSAGEVVVFNINGRDIPIVHRIIKVHEKIPGSGKDDDVRILTKVGKSHWEFRGMGEHSHTLSLGGASLLYWQANSVLKHHAHVKIAIASKPAEVHFLMC